MAKFQMELPKDIMADFQKVYSNSEQIFGAMTKAGAEVAQKNAQASVPLPEMASHIKVSVTYKTPSDDGINTKVYFSGYLPFKGNRKTFSRSNGYRTYVTAKGVPVEFLANLYEYGRSSSPFPKQPFFRKSFKKGQIEKAMLKAQKEASGGILDE